MSRAPMSTCFAAYPESGKITPSRIPSGKNAKGFFFVCSQIKARMSSGTAARCCPFLFLSSSIFFYQGRVTLQRVLVLRIDGAEAHASSFSCSHDHDHAGEWRRFTGLTIHLILQTSGQKPDFRTVQDMVLEPSGVRAGGNQ